MILSKPRPIHTPIYAPPTNHIVFNCAALDMVTGYGQIAVQIITTLLEQGLKIDVIPPRNWQPRPGHPLPELIAQNIKLESEAPWRLVLDPPGGQTPDDRPFVKITMWESGRIPQDWVKRLNQAAAVIVPCEWNQICFDAAGVKAPLFKIPLGINTNIFHETPYSRNPNFVFGTAGKTAHGGVRKGLSSVIIAFQEAFPHNQVVRLQLKVHEECDFDCISHPDPRIKIIRATYNEAQMADWLSGLDCYVTMATGEGFGLIPLQAMAIGRPVIAAIAHGHAEYMTPNSIFPVKYDLELATERWAYCGYWYQPNKLDVIAWMRHLAYFGDVENRRQSAADRAAKFSWGRYNESLLQVLQTVGMIRSLDSSE